MLEQMGATPVNMVAPDIYVALERGALDGAVFAAASSTGYKLQEVVKGVAGNVSWGSNAGVMVMNEAKFQSLPADLQQLILDVGREVGHDIAVEYNKGSDEALAVLVEGGVNNYELPADVMEALQAAQAAVAEEWLSQMNGRGLPAQQVLDEATTAAGLTN
jgi:TRAP-type C4-dicarboxylate transport system substrate-binding protein